MAGTATTRGSMNEIEEIAGAMKNKWSSCSHFAEKGVSAVFETLKLTNSKLGPEPSKKMILTALE